MSLYGLFVSPEQVAAGLGHLARGGPGSLLSQQLRHGAGTGHAAGVALFYRFSCVSHLELHALLPGALMAAVGMVIVTAGFGVYADLSARYSAVYGAFAGAVIAMLASYLGVYVVLLGAVLNVELSGTAARIR